MSIHVRDLWYRTPQTCDCTGNPDEDDYFVYTCPHDTIGGWHHPMFRGVLPSGRMFVTDARIAILVDELAGCQEMPVPTTVSTGNIKTVGLLLVLPARVDEIPTRMFAPQYLNPIEAAGYRVRPLDDAARHVTKNGEHVHGIINADGQTVGLLMPIRADAEITDQTVLVSR